MKKLIVLVGLLSLAGSAVGMEYGNIALIRAINRKEDLVHVRELIEKGANLNAKTVAGTTVLQHAIENERFDIVGALINAGVSVKEELYKRASVGDADVVSELIRADYTGKINDSELEKVLIEAVKKGHLNVVEALTSKPNIPLGEALMFAAAGGYLDIVKALIKARARLDEKADIGITALGLAAYNNHLGIVIALVEAGADANITDNSGNKALDHGWNYEKIRNVLYPRTTGAWRRRYSQKRYTVPAAIAAAAYLGYKKPWKPGK